MQEVNICLRLTLSYKREKELKSNGTSTSTASERSDGHTEMDRRLKKVVNDECLSSSSSKSEISAEWSSCEEVDAVDNGTKKNKPKMTLTEISGEWSSCEEVDAVDNGNSSELVSASMESVCSHNISEATKELAANQWSSSDENGEQYFDIEIMSSTDEDHSDGKNKSENVTLVQRVRQRTNDAECDKELERDVSNLENGSYGKDIRSTGDPSDIEDNSQIPVVQLKKKEHWMMI
ncbi:hypothetical protein DAPPUDRAFT_245607 [Daphnia pulex]|uniref:Uncharacterized protein n=1 Tax=Daphnia pulex TaxID=6669 RepID=E9GNN5_DAPPU|nr:hypothetical protein DAPPUDRAFT_245607 [Daphnia pulex]|eukprot:EFX78930.1 hypothetical protein DAPPUDRAFT_245607 [Daphnia pulex]